MPLNYCLSISSLDPADAADVRALVRANGGDEAAGVQQYIDGIMRDVEELQAKVAPRTFNQSDEPFGPTSRENLTDKEREALAQIRAILRPPGYNEAVLAGGLEAARNVDPNDPRTFNQPAWHGSPHLFDRFSTEFMGTGEGAQAFGWGSYFASRRSVAEFYRENLSKGGRGQLSLAGVVPPTPNEGLSNSAGIALEDLSKLLVTDAGEVQTFSGLDVEGRARVLSMVRTLIQDPKVLDAVVGLVPVDVVNMLSSRKFSSEMLLDDPAMFVDLFPIDPNDLVPGGVSAMDVLTAAVALSAAKVHTGLGRFDVSAADLIAAVSTDGHDALQSLTGKIPQPSEFRKGRLYKVDIPEDSELLAWDVPLSEQSEGVRAKIDALVAERGLDLDQAAQDMFDGKAEDLDGRAFYQWLSGAIDPTGMGDERAASLALRDAGIPGHRFLDQGSRFIPQNLPDNPIANEARKFLEQHNGDADAALVAFDASNPVERFASSERDEVRKVIRAAAKKPTYNYVIYDDSRINVLDFEQRQGTGPRGSIEFPSGGLENGETIIRLFESANMSTLIHESGHFFLEAFRTLAEKADAPKTMKDDLAAINEWLGHESGAYGVDAQEKWARGFEAYTMEGKAPSLALADAFARFKQWLVQIYKTVRGLNVQLTPEIREVMDRMLATDEEIAQAREEANMNPLFTDAGAAGMSEADFRAYQRLARRSTEQAEQTLLEKTMAKIRREREVWYKDERKAVAAEVAATVNTRPEYRLIEAMANGRWLGDETITVEDMRLDREELVSRYGEGVIAELSRTKFGGKRAIYGGDMSVEAAADFFGFRNADEMVRILQNTIKRKEFIVQETDKIMLDRYGDPFEDGSITEEAMAAIHSEQQAQTVAAEARQLAVRAGRPATNITARIFKARAQAMIGRMQVRQVRAARFLQAERQAARNAERAFARIVRTAANQRVSPEDAAALAEAQRFKEQQLLNHYLYMEARDVEAYVKTGRERMRRYERQSVRQKLDGGYIEQIDAILSDYDFRVVSQVALDRRESLLAFVTRMSTEAGVPVPGQFKEDGTPVLGEGREGDLAIDERLINEANRKHYSRLSVDELRGLFDTIANLDHLGRFKNELRAKNKKRQLNRSVDRVVSQIETNVGTGKAHQNEGARHKLRNVLDTILNIDTMAIEYDVGDEMGAFYEEIKQPIDDAAAEEQRRNVEMMKAHDALWMKYYTGKEIAEMKTKRIVPNGNGYAWSKLEILEAVSNAGNPEGLDRLTSQTVAEDRRLTVDQLQAMIDTLDEKDMNFIQERIDLINSFWPELEALGKRSTAVRPKKIDAVPIKWRDQKTIPGGYFPIKYDSIRSQQAAKNEESTFQKQNTAGNALAKVKAGMMKPRQKTVPGMTLAFEPTTAIRHMRDTIRVITLSETVDNTARLLNHPRVAQAFFNAGRKSDWETLRLWLDDVAAGPIFNADPWNSVFRFVKTNFTMAKLAFNVKTMALQTTGLASSAAVVGKRRMLKAFVDYLGGRRNPEEMVAQIVELSPFMAERRTTMQKDVYDIHNDLAVVSPVAGKFTKARSELFKWGFEGIVRVQFHVVDVPTWIAGYRAGMARFGNQEQAVRYADRMVARAQASGAMPDRAAMERGTLNRNTRQSDVVRSFTTLGGYMLNKFNRLRVQQIRMANATSPGEVLNAALDIGILLWAEALVMGIAHSLMADDDDEKDGSFAKFIAAETASALLGGIPIVRDLPSAYRGFSAGGPIDEAVEAPASLVNQIWQGEVDRTLIKDALGTAGVATGLPTVQPMRVIDFLMNDDVPPSELFFGKNPLTR